MYAHSYLQSARLILDRYDGSLPFAAWLKQFFREHKKYGSRDRRHVGEICYSVFRTGRSLGHLPWEQQVLFSLFLCGAASNELLQALSPEWNGRVAEPPEQKMEALTSLQGFDPSKIFPCPEELSPLVDRASFLASFFVQPQLFLRVRPGREALVQQELDAAGISYRQPRPGTLELPHHTRTEDLPGLDSQVVVQDLSSQQTLDDLLPLVEDKKTLSAWDCCAASGGKSLLLHDCVAGVRITVSDIRKTILVNLERRFARAGIRSYRSMVFDAGRQVLDESFDLVICDAPCSGSGTWGRTPEQLRFFRAAQIDHYTELQGAITRHAVQSVRKEGFFLYITCSVFRRENEDRVDELQKSLGLTLLSQQYYQGHRQRADTLFAALFRR